MAKFDSTLPFRTRDGRKARLLSDTLNSNKCIAAVITEKNDEEIVFSFYEDGRENQECLTVYDLINLPTKKEGWIVMFKNKDGETIIPTEWPCSKKEQAMNDFYVKEKHGWVVHIEWEENGNG